jgi:hypothetical protein
MNDTWNILNKELAVNGIKIIDQNTCQCFYGDRLVNMTLKAKIKLNNKKIRQDKLIFEELWKELIELFKNRNSSILHEPIDEKMICLFVFSVKDLMNFVENLLYDYNFSNKELSRRDVYISIKSALDTDYAMFPKDVISSVPDYKMAIDWIYRDACKLSYVNKLLKFVSLGEEKISMIKVARGISGPWANLDLPMLERVFKWDDIEEEVRGRDKDLRKQRRYRQGLENYNNDGRVGDGYFWRELRNEPYSWYDRFDDSPYPGRSILMRG